MGLVVHKPSGRPRQLDDPDPEDNADEDMINNNAPPSKRNRKVKNCFRRIRDSR